MYFRIAFFAALLAGTAPVHAQDASYAQTDAELNRLFQKIESRLAQNHDGKQKLITAQRAWIAFRDDECKFAASGVEGGTVYKDVLEACMQDMAKARIANFNTYLKCEEGDMGCPVPAK